MKTYKTRAGLNFCLAKHARDRMAERQIRLEHISSVIDDCDVAFTDNKGNECRMAELDDGRKIRLVVDKRLNPMVVITVIIL